MLGHRQICEGSARGSAAAVVDDDRTTCRRRKIFGVRPPQLSIELLKLNGFTAGRYFPAVSLPVEGTTGSRPSTSPSGQLLRVPGRIMETNSM